MSDADTELETLLAEIFDADDMLVVVRRFDDRLAKRVNFDRSAFKVASDLVAELKKDGPVAPRFFSLLVDARTKRREQILAVARRMGVEIGPWYEQPVDWSRAAFLELRETLVLAIPRVDAIQQVAQKVQVAFDPNVATSSLRAWEAVVEGASSAGKLRLLVESAILDTTSEHLRARLKALLGIDARSSAASAPFAWAVDERTTEALIGEKSTLLDVAFLERGTEAAKAVVQLRVDFPRGSGKGTGFLIGPNLVLTNHHVLFDWDDRDAMATKVIVRLNFQQTPKGTLADVVEREGTVASIRANRDHDWAVLELATPAPAEFPPLSLDRATSPPREGDMLSIVQHPLGLEKKVAVQHNTVAFVNDDVVQYLTDTEVGSSGAPVFNSRWEVVALHHRGGRLTIPGMSRTAWRNQGIRIERVIAGLKDRPPT